MRYILQRLNRYVFPCAENVMENIARVTQYLREKIAAAGGDPDRETLTLVETVEALKNGTAVRIKQDDALATYAAKIEKEDCLLNFSMDATALHNLIRGLSPIPLAFTHTPDGKLLKVTASRVISAEGTHAECGKVLALDGEIAVACGKGILALTAVLPEGKGKMNAADFIRGRKIATGDVLK